MTQIVLLWTKGFESSAHMVIHQVWAARINSCLSPARQVTWQLWKIAIAPQQCKWWIQVKEWRLAVVPSASKGWGQCQSQGFLQDRQGAHATSAALRWWTRWRGTDGRSVTSCKAASNCFLLMPIVMCSCLHQTAWATVYWENDTTASVHCTLIRKSPRWCVLTQPSLRTKVEQPFGKMVPFWKGTSKQLPKGSYFGSLFFFSVMGLHCSYTLRRNVCLIKPSPCVNTRKLCDCDITNHHIFFFSECGWWRTSALFCLKGPLLHPQGVPWLGKTCSFFMWGVAMWYSKNWCTDDESHCDIKSNCFSDMTHTSRYFD